MKTLNKVFGWLFIVIAVLAAFTAIILYLSVGLLRIDLICLGLILASVGAICLKDIIQDEEIYKNMRK